MKRIILLKAVLVMDTQTSTTSTDIAELKQSSAEDEEDLFDFVKLNARIRPSSTASGIENEVDTYLNSMETSTSSLLQYPHLV